MTPRGYWPQKVAAETGSFAAAKKRGFCRLLINKFGPSRLQ
jgi:hypothetical protein